MGKALWLTIWDLTSFYGIIDALREIIIPNYILGKITCPTLIIGGEEDKVVGFKASIELKKHITGSMLHSYPSLGHAAYEEAKDFNQCVLDFLEE